MPRGGALPFARRTARHLRMLTRDTRHATHVVRRGGRCCLHRRREGMRAHRCRVWRTHTPCRARRSHRHGTTVTRMHCPHRHSIATALFRHDLDQRMCVGAIHGVHDAARCCAESFVRASCTARCPVHDRRTVAYADPQPSASLPIPVRKRTIDSNAAPAISARASARRRALADAGGRASTCCRTSGGRGRTARRSGRRRVEALLDHHVAGTQRERRMIAAGAAVETGEAVAGFRHRIDQRRVAARDFVGRDRPAAGKACRLAVLAVGVDRAVVRVVVVELDAADASDWFDRMIPSRLSSRRSVPDRSKSRSGRDGKKARAIARGRATRTDLS